MKLAIAILLLCAAIGCGDNVPADQCRVPPGWDIGYQDCGTPGCVAGCGVLPQDGSPGHLLSVGCTVQIGTSQMASAVCVASCADCR